MTRVARFYVRVGDRLVHGRRIGEGPLVVLLHGSPQSSLAVMPMARALAARGLTAIALDNPGNGCAHPLPGAPEDVAAYGVALGETLDALGIGRAALYGFHTGAAHAAAFAALHPERVSALLLDGFAVWTAAERADMLAHYLTPFIPSWDGAHLAWLWARMETQSVFFPWYAHTRAHLMDGHETPPPEAIHANILDFLRAGDGYRAPYASAFHADGQAMADALRTDTLICAGARDPLCAHLERLTHLPPNIALQRFDRDRDAAIAAMADWLARRARDSAPPPQDDSTFRFVDAPGGALHVRFAAGGARRPLVVLHDSGAAMQRFSHVFDALATRRPLIAIDLPGHGESGDDFLQAPRSVEDYVACVAAALDALGVEAPAVVGDGLGGHIALMLKAQRRAAKAGLVSIASGEDAPRREMLERGMPSCAPRWDGAHLITAWRLARRRALYDPWFQPDAAHVRDGAVDLDIAMIHQACIDLLKAGDRARAAHAAAWTFDAATALAHAGEAEILAEPRDMRLSAALVEALQARGGAIAHVHALADLRARDAEAFDAFAG
ncbi:MAG: alpha/beta fold hydrolase [Hyphomonadaceae bacterium]|nr:alpha/beta fold hydrolase [Hyphomonadaceae bacterium]